MLVAKPVSEGSPPQVVFRFGAGLHSQGSPNAIHERECQDGDNFDLRSDSTYLHPRMGARVVFTCPPGINASSNGFIQLLKADGTRGFGAQFGGTVYSWDGTIGESGGLTAIGTCSPAARLRGRIESNSIKDSTVLIADLAQVEPVLQWDGTTFQRLTTNLSGDFYARYIVVDKERAFYGNVKATTALPHVLVASQQSALANNLGTISVTDKAGAAGVAADDPFFLPTPKLEPIRGLISAFQKLAIATKAKTWYSLSGADATDHTLDELYAGARGIGDEEVVFAGNDIVHGVMGSILALSSTERYGSVKSDGLMRWLHDEVANVKTWMLEYNERLDRVYCIPADGGKVYVLNKALLDAHTRSALFGEAALDISPWARWKTAHAQFPFTPTAMMRMYSPSDGLEYVYVGTSGGLVWQYDSSQPGDGYPAEQTAVTTTRISAPVSLEPAQVYQIKGWVKARKLFSGDITLTALWGGKTVYDSDSVTVTLDANPSAAVWSGSSYWGAANYWNFAFQGRLHRKPFTLPGKSDEVAIKISIASSSLADYAIEEIGIQLTPEQS